MAKHGFFQGGGAIKAVHAEKPEIYLRVIASILAQSLSSVSSLAAREKVRYLFRIRFKKTCS